MRTPVPTPFFPPTSNVPLSTAPVSTATAPTGGQTGVQSGSQTTPLTATSARAGSQAQSPGTRTKTDDTLPPPATVDPTGSTNPPTSAPAPGAPSGQPATPAPVPAPLFDGIYTLTVSQPTNEDFAGKVISFKIGDFSANETALWQQGQTNVFNLTASSSVFVPGPSGTPLASPLRAVPLSQAAPPAPPSSKAPPPWTACLCPKGPQ